MNQTNEHQHPVDIWSGRRSVIEAQEKGDVDTY